MSRGLTKRFISDRVAISRSQEVRTDVGVGARCGATTVVGEA